jgi:hypothetical protein
MGDGDGNKGEQRLLVGKGRESSEAVVGVFAIQVDKGLACAVLFVP